HAAIHQRRVDTDQIQRKTIAQLARQRGLAGSRGAHQEDGWRTLVDGHASIVSGSRPVLRADGGSTAMPQDGRTNKARVKTQALFFLAEGRLTSLARPSPSANCRRGRGGASPTTCSARRPGSSDSTRG